MRRSTPYMESNPAMGYMHRMGNQVKGKTLFTPGPWHGNENIREHLYIECEQGLICDMQLESCTAIGEATTVKANARLITTAPDGYGLAQLILESNEVPEGPIRQAARKLLFKAMQ